MSLQDYLNTRGSNIQTPTFNTQTKIANTTQAVVEDDNKSAIGGLFRWLGKQLMKPQGIAVKELRAVGEGIGTTVSKGAGAGLSKFIEHQKGALNVLTGKEETSYSKELEKVVPEKEQDVFFKTFAIGGDFFVDPLWSIKPVKITKSIGKATKLDKPAKALGQLIKESDNFKKASSLFSNTTGNKAFDEIVAKFRNLRTYREGALIDDAVNLQKDIKKLGKGAEEIITEGLENPSSLAKIKDDKILNITENLKKTYKELLDESRKIGLKVGEIKDYAPHIRTKESFLGSIKNAFNLGVKEFDKAGVEKGRKLKSTIKELTEQGIDIFEKNPAIQLVKKGQQYSKAITSKEFANAVEKFAIPTGVKVSNPMLKNLKFEPEVAKVIDNFYQGIKPDELKVIVKGFDKIQNWWKAQALISPSYHIRNVAGNIWNNFVAGVNPAYYFKAGLIQKGSLKDPKLLEEAKKLGVIDEGWYAKDIAEEVMQRVEGIGNFKKGLNPASQQNYLFRANKKIGSIIENNARLAHYLSKKAQGLSPEKAAESVKKFLFDYGDLTSFEKNIMKRLVPFYTWTRKNIPIQLEGLIKQPAKYVLPHKIVDRLEKGVEVPNEKYMSGYIKENIPVRIRKNKDGNTEYFLLGNWLPYASAIDLLSQPLDGIIGMGTPFVKTPYEYFSNKSTYFKDTLDEPSKIEYRHKQQGEFLGMSLRQKNILLLRNIRILNDMNKWIDKQDPTAVKDSWVVKLLNTMFGKTATYDVGKSKYFYERDTQEREEELKKAIKDAQKRRYTDKADKLKEELRTFLKERH